MKKAAIAVSVIVALAAAGSYGAWRIGAAEVESALERQVAALAARRIAVTAERRSIDGFPFRWRLHLEDVELRATETGWRVSLPWAEAEATLFDLDAIRMRPAPQGRAAVVLDGQIVDFALALVEAEATTTRAGDETRIVADAITATPAGASSAILGIDALDALVSRKNGTLSAQASRLLLAPARIAPELGEATLTDVGVSGAWSGLEGLRAEALEREGALAEVTVNAASSAFLGDVSDDAATKPISGVTGPVATSFKLADGILSIEGATEALSGFGEVSGPFGASAGEMSAARSALSFAMPVRIADAASRYELSFGVWDVLADDALWKGLDPSETLPRDPMWIDVAIGGDARLTRPLSEAADSAEPPAEVLTVEIDRAEGGALGATGDVTGVLTLNEGGAPPDGDLVVTLTGWLGALDALRVAGIVGPDMAQLAMLMASTYGEIDAGEDRLVSRISLRDGAVFANGARVR